MKTILSQEERPGSLQGRVTPEVLHDVFDGAWGEASRSGVRFVRVGTSQMQRDTDDMLSLIGYPGGGFSGEHALLQYDKNVMANCMMKKAARCGCGTPSRGTGINTGVVW